MTSGQNKMLWPQAENNLSVISKMLSSSNYEVKAKYYSFAMNANDMKHFYIPAIQFEKHIELS